MGSQVQTVQALFGALQPVLAEMAPLLNAAHNYGAVVELVLELLAKCAHQMLVFLSQADSQKLYRFALDTIQAYASHAGGGGGCVVRLTRETSAEEDTNRDLLLFMELLMNLISKDLMDLCPFASDNAPISASEVSCCSLELQMH